MGYSILAPFYVSFALFGFCMMLILVIQEPERAVSDHPYTPISSAEQQFVTATSPSSSAIWQEELRDSRSQDQHWTIKAEIFNAYSWIQRTIPPVDIFFNSPVTHFCLAAFFFNRVAFTSEGFMFQYASEKFGWELCRTTWLRVASASGAVFTTLAVCPLLAFTLTNRGYAAHKLDMNVIRICLAILVLSFFAAWLADSGLLLVFGIAL